MPRSEPRILIVDDDEDIRESLSFALEGCGFEVVTAGDGAEALELLAADGPLPVVILLDLRMPRMDGGQFREAQLNDPALADVPVLVLSADGNVAARARSLGTDGWVQKPIELNRLLDEVERFRASTT